MSSISTECRRSSPHAREKVVRARRLWGLARICWLPSFSHVTDFSRRVLRLDLVSPFPCADVTAGHMFQKLRNPSYLLELHCDNLRYLRAPKQPSTRPHLSHRRAYAQLSSIHIQPDHLKAIYHASQSRFLPRNLTGLSMKRTWQVTSWSIPSALCFQAFQPSWVRHGLSVQRLCVCSAYFVQQWFGVMNLEMENLSTI